MKPVYFGQGDIAWWESETEEEKFFLRNVDLKDVKIWEVPKVFEEWKSIAY